MTPLGPVRVPVPTAHTRARTHKVCVCARVWERERDLMLPMPPSLILPFHDTQGMDGTARGGGAATCSNIIGPWKGRHKGELNAEGRESQAFRNAIENSKYPK